MINNNIISKIHFIIVSFFIFIVLLLCTIFITLQHGLFINKTHISNIQVKQLYIKWDEKINISIKEIDINRTSSSSQANLHPKEINNFLKKIPNIKKIFNSITIKKIVVGAIDASFHYKDKEDGFFVASSKNMELNTSLHIEKNSIYMKILDFKEREKEIYAKGRLYFDTQNVAVFSNINMNIANEANLTLHTQSDSNETKYSIESHKDITDFSKIIHLIKLPKEVMYWAYDAIDMQTVHLKSIKGFVAYNKLNQAYKNLSIQADINKLHYTYNSKLDAIQSQKTELELKNGTLYIRPKEAYTYGTYLGKSWLKIDFTKPQELLTLHLLFDGKLNKNMLHILKTYKIKLPFLQKRGRVKTDLTLKVNLRTIDVDAQGTFFTQKANFDYLGLNLDIYDALIKLNNNDVTVTNMQAKYKNIATAHVDLKYNAKKEQGIIDFRVNNVNFKNFHYASTTKPLLASFHINKKNNFITLQKSQLEYKNKIITLDAVQLPFNLQKLNINIPATFAEVQGVGNGYLSGTVDLKNLNINLDLDLLKFSYDGVSLHQTNTPLKITYNKKLMITSANDIYFSASGSIYKISHMLITAKGDNIYLKHTNIAIDKYITTNMYAKFNTQTKKSRITLSNFILKDPTTDKLLYKNKKILLSAYVDDQKIKISSQELDGIFASQKSGWKLQLNAINRLYSQSPFLKKFHLNHGNFTLYRNKNDKDTKFEGSLNYPYKILVKNNTPTSFYTIKGNIYKEKVHCKVNNVVDIKIKNDIKVNLNNSVVNIFELKRLLQDTNASDKKSKPLDVRIMGNNSSIYLTKERKFIYDTLKIQYFHNILTAQLHYKKGRAGLKYAKNQFELYGKDFNDKFMENIFILSKFENGSLDFEVHGDIDAYSGVVYASKTTMKDYKILNNILAFINTVPSLVTFSLPGYNSHGLYVKNAYLKFTSKKSIFHLSDIYLNSKEMDILGKGDVNMNKNSLDITLNLKTDLGSQLSKVPVVGYILFNGNSISTTLKITGKADNPTVKSLLAQDIIVAPLNIIKRTLLLPYKLVKDTIDSVK